MTPVDRDIQLKFRVSAEEREMLERLAEGDGVTPTDYVRTLIRRTYAKEFNAARPPRPTDPTFGGLLGDLLAPAHYTAGNIAARMGASLGAVLSGLDVLRRLSLVQQVDGSGFNSTWEVLVPPGKRVATLETVLEVANAAGLREEILQEWSEDERMQRARRARGLAKRAEGA